MQPHAGGFEALHYALPNFPAYPAWMSAPASVTVGTLFNPVARPPKENVMSVKLKQLIADTQSAYRSQPDAAKATFRSSSRLTEGFRSEVSIRQHRLAADEPAALGGADSGPNPVELILAALGSCQEITYRAYATALGIPLDSVAVELSGDIDLRGFFGVDDTVRSGFQNIRGTVNIESSASAAELQKLRAVVDAHCPVLDMLANKVPVSLALSIKSKAAA